MIMEAAIRVNGDRVSIQVPQAGMSLDVANIIALYQDGTRYRVVELGQTAESLQAMNAALWEKQKSRITFVPMFDVASIKSGVALAAIEYYIGRSHIAIRHGARFLFRFIDRIECSLWLPGYENLPSETRQAFEFSLQKVAWLDALSINGRSLGWPIWQRLAATVSMDLCQYLLAFGFMIYGYTGLVRSVLDLLPREWSGAFAALGIAILCVAMGVGVGMPSAVGLLLGLTLWMATASRILPKDLLRATFLYRQHKLIIRILRPITHAFLGEAEQN
jgi:hypothetical protein